VQQCHHVGCDLRWWIVDDEHQAVSLPGGHGASRKATMKSALVVTVCSAIRHPASGV
jgi:hypothetical protein